MTTCVLQHIKGQLLSWLGQHRPAQMGILKLYHIYNRHLYPWLKMDKRRHQANPLHSFMPRAIATAPRIVLVTATLGHGGAERQLVNTAIELHKANYNTRIVVTQHASAQQADLSAPPGVHRDYLEQHGSSQDSLDPVLLKLVERYLPRHKHSLWNNCHAYFTSTQPDIVHLWQDETNVIAGLAAVCAGVPRIIMGTRNMAAYHFLYYRPYMEVLYRDLMALQHVTWVNNSQAGRQDYARWLKLPEQSGQVIYNGSHIEAATHTQISHWRQNHGIPKTAQVVGGIFRFWPEKNPDLWLKTAALLAKQHPDVWFILIGDGPLRQHIQKRASQLGLSERLIIPGQMDNIATALGNMDTLLLTSHQEGMPNVLIEAQYLGIPVVTTNAGGSAETLKPNVTGFVCNRPSVDELAKLVRRTLEDTAWRTKACNQAPDFARQHFSLSRMLQDTLAAYNRELTHITSSNLG